MAKGIKRRLQKALRRVDAEIKANSQSGGIYASGLANEGYAGGYRDALSDVGLLLHGVEPNDRRGYWIEPMEKT